MPKYAPLTKGDLRAKIKEIEDRIKQMDRREKTFNDFKKWMEGRKLEISDIRWYLLQMKPRRAAKPAKSKLPLQPPPRANGHDGASKLKPLKGDPVFRAAIKEARVKAEMTAVDVGKKIGVSSSSVGCWERGLNVPADDLRLKVLKLFSLPLHLGAEASKDAGRYKGKAH